MDIFWNSLSLQENTYIHIQLYFNVLAINILLAGFQVGCLHMNRTSKTDITDGHVDLYKNNYYKMTEDSTCTCKCKAHVQYAKGGGISELQVSSLRGIQIFQCQVLGL